ncbi:MAG: NAD(P)/FAD-dependent oxidoreductase [Clostridia bacterium]|nr:NAD(P)/FAD-dependent oxidoreductase [Clostridia bacterium]
MNTGNISDIAIIGAGASGLMAASFASECGATVTVFEKNTSEKKLEADKYFDNAYLGKKLLITGKGRCNLTNDCSNEDFLKNVPANPKFLYSALGCFDTASVMKFFEDNGCPVKVERGDRVFPVSDKSRDVLDALKRSITRENCTFINSEVTSVEKSDGVFLVKCRSGKQYGFRRVIICTGGLSYPVTGSTGDGYEFARSFGHTITPTRGSLVPIELDGSLHSEMQGLSLKNVVLTLFDKKNKKVFSELGEMLFTHFGISGPLVLSCSAHMRKDISEYRAEIDLKPALDEETLDKRLVSDFTKYQNRDIKNAMTDLLPQKMIAPFVEVCSLPSDIKPNSLKKEQRRVILNTLKHFPLELKSLRPVTEAVITSGGIPVKEINPSTMESKICEGLYFAGEIIDVDAYTGGFNLQIAFSTAKLAAVSCVQSLD